MSASLRLKQHVLMDHMDFKLGSLQITDFFPSLDGPGSGTGQEYWKSSDDMASKGTYYAFPAFQTHKYV